MNEDTRSILEKKFDELPQLTESDYRQLIRVLKQERDSWLANAKSIQMQFGKDYVHRDSFKQQMELLAECIKFIEKECEPPIVFGHFSIFQAWNKERTQLLSRAEALGIKTN